jgi:hypothetical protein
MIVAIVSLVVALSGTAVAAGVFISHSSQLGRGVVTGRAIRSHTITGDKLATDAGNQSYEFLRTFGPDTASGDTVRVMSANLGPGEYVIVSKTVISDLSPSSNLLDPGKAADAQCILAAGSDSDHSRVFVRASFGSAPGNIVNQLSHNFPSGGNVTLDCSSTNKWRATDSTIIATRVQAIHRTGLPNG